MVLVYVPVAILGGDDQGFGIILMALVGVGIALASYLYVRR